MGARLFIVCTLAAAVAFPTARVDAGAYGTGNAPSRFSNAHHLTPSARGAPYLPPGSHDPCSGPRYRPDVDVHGRLVESAELPSSEPVIHPIPRYGLLHDLPSGPWRPKRAEVGVIDVDPDTGIVAFDGMPLNSGHPPEAECGGGPLAGGDAPVPLK